ncbi:MAG: radical SAM protein [Clostridiales bacterium]|jgi:MoaA/NifB/PqqE/SkfB family radical SAM enzyme|nr:radical SAM protein [Clostridiales bacterium]
MVRDILIGPHQVSLDITNKCNLRCLHCYNNSGENYQSSDELSDEQVLGFIDEFKDIKLLNMCFCGGEPLLRKDLVIECAKRLKSYGCQNMAMVTNALLLDEKAVDDLSSAGLTRIQISLDGATSASHDRIRNQAGVYEKALSGIATLIERKIDFAVAFTPTEFNIGEFKDFYYMLQGMGMNGNNNIRVQPLMIMGRASGNAKKINPTEKQYRELVNTINLLNQSDNKIRVEWGDPVDHLIRFRNMNIVLNSVMIRANGDVIVDPYLPLVLGNIRKHPFLQYWEHGLNNMWGHELIKKLAENIMSIRDMDNEYDNLPKIWRDKDFVVDLIDDDFEAKFSDILNTLI